jgi:uncharacterized repeat protein (TIGR04138 family)
MFLAPDHPLAALLREDQRYKLEAYAFVFEALAYAQNVLGMGHEEPSEPLSATPGAAQEAGLAENEAQQPHRHVTGQELCEAIRRLALEQYGLMAKTVLNSWGIHSTSDIGEIVYNLIRIGHMGKTARDRREDFDNVFDFDTAFRQEFCIE